jgi:protein-S-isoprenylcysteine O-methyltransferase Ste14
VRALRHVAAIGLLPGVVAVLVPALLAPWDDGPAAWPLVLAGCLLMIAGVGMIAWTVALFAAVGRGTLAPWDPTERLVVRGPYRHVRNPMISGVFALLVGEAALFGSLALLTWFAVVLAVNAAYLPLVEEPGLRRRFGAGYDAYRENVPRWLPRLRPWEGG